MPIWCTPQMGGYLDQGYEEFVFFFLFFFFLFVVVAQDKQGDGSSLALEWEM